MAKSSAADIPRSAGQGSNVAPGSEVSTISFGRIVVDLEFNSRKTYDKAYITWLADSITSEGLKVPLKVRKLGEGNPASGGVNYGLVEGFCRFKALSELNTSSNTPVRVVLESYETDLDLYIGNMVENTGRKPVPDHELAERLYEFEQGTYRRVLGADEDPGSAPKLSRTEIARRTGISIGHVGNLIRSRTQVAEVIQKKWGPEKIPLTNMIAMAAMTKKEKDEESGKIVIVPDEEKQSAAYTKWKQQADEIKADRAEGKPRKKAKKADEEEKSAGATKAEIRHQIELLTARIEKVTGVKGEEERLLIATTKQRTLKWVIGELAKL